MKYFVSYEIIEVMNQRGFSALGILFIILLLFSGLVYGLHKLWSLFGAAYPVSTSSWKISETDTFMYKHPKDWQVVGKSSDVEAQTTTYLAEIPFITIPVGFMP